MQESGIHPPSGRRSPIKVLLQVSGLPHEFLGTKIPAVSRSETHHLVTLVDESCGGA